MSHKNSNYWSPRKRILPSPAQKAEEVRVYLSETGEVRVETKHFREGFAPEEFLARLHTALLRRQATDEPEQENAETTFESPVAAQTSDISQGIL